MKNRMIGLCAMLLFAVATVFAQDVPSGVVSAFKKGSASELKPFLANSVELTLPGQNGVTDQAKSVSILNDFFTKNKPTGFSVNHQGKKGESSFAIGTLTTSSGKYRVNCFFKKIQNNYLIHQIRIEKTNE